MYGRGQNAIVRDHRYGWQFVFVCRIRVSTHEYSTI